MSTWNAFGPEYARTEDRAAVRTAEQTVADAWIGLLLAAETETATILDVHIRARGRVANRVQVAQRAGDPAALARSQTELEIADAACHQASQAHERSADQLARELRTWSGATAQRVRQALTDRSSAGLP